MIRKRSFVAAAAVCLALGGAISRTGLSTQEGGLEDGALGLVLDREGVASVKSLAPGSRWRALERGLLLEPGDWVEVGTRGANAAALRLASGVELTAGPGALVELTSRERIALHRGDLACDVPAGARLTVEGAKPGAGERELEARAVLRNADGLIETLEEDPKWLAGYAADTSTEAVGALLAQVDGRDVPLTIGYHKVTVDVRDQLARTVVEQSFVNHTGRRLEGVFYFPLPADASISGFGMWIDGELVQGDIVEKQRAREIYETILREKRDPGLLEWTGGNIFKARVFPIDSEKRVRISYTQVLPREGDGFRYRYALESELLRLHPLGRLEIQVNVHSARAIADVRSPTHAGRVQATEHSASFEFTAEEYTPERDFELRVDLEPSDERLTLVPHRRGDDGYFMLLVDAPTPDPSELAARNGPLELLILADTSGSMWGPQRATQVAFVEALLAALEPGDRFDLATCDVETRWAFGELADGADRDRREAAQAFLAAREPLGWSDLETAFASAIERAGHATHVIYVGDGVPTSGAADPALLARAIEDLYGGRGTFHAVVPGSSSEPAVLRAIASLGGGSLRTIGAGADALQTAHALLDELTRPAIKDLALDFRGLPVAAVYPEHLPNLPAGGQQVVVGRFDATQGDLSGAIALSGSIDGRAWRAELAVELPAGEEGNSFVPRLWARAHLDHLLDQGSSPEIRERIAALSADYQIVTPYTSFLVLESDADRERFGVAKSFRMRDGEEFFLEGREAGKHDLVSAQMQAAGTWRLRLQAEARARLASMGRELTALLGPEPRPIDGLRGVGYAEVGALGSGGRYRGDKDEMAPMEADWAADALEEESAVDSDAAADEELPESRDDFAVGNEQLRAERQMAPGSSAVPRSPGMEAKKSVAYERVASDGRLYWPGPPPSPWAGLFPALPAPRAAPAADTWPAEVRELLLPLDRRARLAAAGSGWRVVVADTGTARPGTVESELLIGGGAWWTSGPRLGTGAYPIAWLADGRRSVVIEGWRLGRTRAAEDGDGLDFESPLRWYLDRQGSWLGQYSARREEAGAGRARVVLSMTSSPENEFVLELDVERGVVLEEAWRVGGKVTQRWVHGEFREVGGLWWPGSVRYEAEEPSYARLARVTVESLGAAEVAERMATERGRLADALLLERELEILEAKQAIADGPDTTQVGIDARLAVLANELLNDRPERVAAQLAALGALAGERPGLERLSLHVLQSGRRQEEVRARTLELAADLALRPRAGELGMARDLVGMSHAFGPHEALDLLRVLLAVVERGADDPSARREWDMAFLSALERAQRTAEHLVAARAAAERHPDDQYFQILYARVLAASGDLDGALGWLEAQDERGELPAHERRALRSTLLDLLWNGYRLEDVVRRFEAWDALDPASLDGEACWRYLAAHVYLDRQDQALGHADAWAELAAKAQREGHENERLGAVIRFLQGQGYYYGGGLPEEAQLERLAALARALTAHGTDDYLINQIVFNWQLRQSDAGRALLAELYQKLQGELFELPAAHVRVLVGWLHSWNTDVADQAAWDALALRIFERWSASDDPFERTELGNALLPIASEELRREFHLANLDEAETEPDRHQRALALWAELINGQWSAETEARLFELFAVLEGSAGPDPEPVRDALVLKLVELVDWVLARHTEQTVAGLPKEERLTRRGLEASRKAARATAGAELSVALAGREHELEPAWLREWVVLERLWLDTIDRRKAGGDESPGRKAFSLAALHRDEVGDRERASLRARVLAARALATSALLLTREADAELEAKLAAELLRLGEAGVELPDGRGLWRDLWLALDRLDALEDQLATWFGDGRRYAALRYGIDRALLLAERGELAPAVELLERIEAFDELAPELLFLASDWLTALDQREAARAARVRAFETQGEGELAWPVQHGLEAYQRAGTDVPEELDADVPLRFIALMRKADHPAQHLWALREYYRSTKDFRLLECLPDAVIGHSAQGIYAFLEEVGSLAETIDEEAVADRVLQGIERRAVEELTDTDRRALALLRFQILLRAARQTHGTERHAERSLAALESAFPGDLAEGEALALSQFLVRQGRLEPAALAAEQLRQLRELTRAGTDPDDRLGASASFARALWTYERRDEAVRVLETALDECRELNAGSLPEGAFEALAELSSWLASMHSFAQAEALWNEEIAAARSASLRQRLELGRLQLLVGRYSALREANDYTRAHAELLLSLEPRTNEAHARDVIGLLCDLWENARHLPSPRGALEAARDFAFARLPAILGRYQYRQGQQSVQRLGDLLERTHGAATALEFLVTRAETEPAWLAFESQDFWPQHGWRLAYLRRSARQLGADLQRRTLALVVRELRRDLRSRAGRSRSVYDQRYSEYWPEQRAVFLATALEVLVERASSGMAVVYVAEYLFDGLGARSEALEALAAAHARGALDLGGQVAYARYLQTDGRWAESLRVVRGLVRAAPADVESWAMLMRAHWHLEHAEELAASLGAAEEALRAAGAWSEHSIEVLALAAGECGLEEESVELIDAAIALHVRSAPNRGIGDGVLSRFYEIKARALADLGRTWEAVEAASGAIVAWGPRHSQRHEALELLASVLAGARDLPGYVARFEAEVRASGLENPIVRKALAVALAGRGDHQGAAAQLQQALLVEPNDLESHAALVEAYRALGRSDLAAAALLARARTAGHELALYAELGNELRASDPALAERAYTNLVELSAHESEGHAALAAVREHQRAFDGALLHWEHVIRIRTQEPTGYLGRARALIGLERVEEARAALDELRGREWPEHFGNVQGEVEALERELPRRG